MITRDTLQNDDFYHTIDTCIGEVTEWLKVHAWKACLRCES
jgi:hypothetical protein